MRKMISRPADWRWRHPGLAFGLLLVLGLILGACQSSGDAGAEQVYRPPTQVVEATPLSLPAQDVVAEAEPADPRPTVAPVCTNALWFLQDVTIPDGSLVTPGARLDKRWLVQNSGTCNWTEGYEIRLVAGPSLGVPVTQALYPALSGTDVTLRMTFIAPEQPGAYRSAWQAFDPQGVEFGDPFFIDFIVSEE